MGTEEQSTDANLGNRQLTQVKTESPGQSCLHPSWLLQARLRQAFQGSHAGMNQIHTQPQVPLISDSMAPLTEAPRTK